MTDLELMTKYNILDNDWDNMQVVDAKMTAQTVVGLFIALENTLASKIDPYLGENIDNVKSEILTYLDTYFIDIRKEFDINDLPEN
jgi:uncharacterized protein YxjI